MSEAEFVGDPRAAEAALVDRIGDLERTKSASAAEQAKLTVELDTMRRVREAAAGVPAAQRGRGLGAEIGLARHDSPKQGRHHLAVAGVLVHDMPHTLAALAAGVLSEYRAALIVAEAAALNAADRRVLDAELCANPSGLAGLGNKRITARARSIAYRLDSQAAADRARRAPGDRGVSMRPGRDGMGYVTAFLPIPQAIAVHGALKTAADTSADARPRGHVMADTLIERVTGRPAEVPVPIAVNMVLTDQTLLAADTTPSPDTRLRAHPRVHRPTPDRDRDLGRPVEGHPAQALPTPRLGGVGGDGIQGRLFPKALAAFIDIRDDTCRTPYCDAPIRHRDHAQPNAKGGKTSAVNGLGECEACNYTKEAPGWQVSTAVDDHGTHTAVFTTPTGARHRSNAPPVIGDIATITDSGIEVQLGIELGRWAA